jgi:hypothetical protein
LPKKKSNIYFYEKVEMITKSIAIIESFVIVSSFDCDLEIENSSNKKKPNKFERKK